MKTAFAPVGHLDAGSLEAMRALLDRHFTGVDAAVFAEDLAAKTHVLRLFDEAGQLVGFSTLDHRLCELDGARAAVLYSGDTIVDPSAWASASLGAVWVAAVLELHRAEAGDAPLWWLLLTSGVRTHRYLGACCRRYHPAPEGRDDPRAAALLPHLARARFGDAFDADAGVVRLRHPHRLRPHLAEVPSRLAVDAHTRVFLARNPGHEFGDELVSLCQLDESNLSPAGSRALAIGRRIAAVAGA